MKRFQECNKMVKLWRYRWYLLIPFKWCSYHLKCYFNNDSSEFNGKTLWHLLIGDAQINMDWTHTQEEVEEMFKNMKK